MKIGIFGDSFAEKNHTKIWWRYLESNHGHSVESFGESGSSLSFSMEMIENYSHRFDKLIWCFTSVNRISFWYKDRVYHNTGSKPQLSGDAVLDQRLEFVNDFIVLAFDWAGQERFGKALAEHSLRKYENMMIIPCFSTPIYFMEQHKFNLFDLCNLEIKHLFPGKDPAKIHCSDLDARHGHLTDTNQKILADLINQNLDLKIFDTSYENFVFDQSIYKEFTGKT